MLLEQACWWVGQGLWVRCLSPGGWSWVPESLTAGAWGSWTSCLHTDVRGLVWDLWWAGLAVDSEGLYGSSICWWVRLCPCS